MELPEILTLARQTGEVLSGKKVLDVYPPTDLHKFAFFEGDPAEYSEMLRGKKVVGTAGAGIFADIKFSGGLTLTVGDGVNVRYGKKDSPVPKKYQLLITFDDDTFLVMNIAMYGSISLYKGAFENEYYRISFSRLSPLADEFDLERFKALISGEKKNISAKALMATGQRLPGLGNGSLQDILFRAGINPKRKIATFSEADTERLFNSMKYTFRQMLEAGGRDTETDLHGNKGGYKTILSAKTSKLPCPVCGGAIVKEAYMGGSVYYCPACQPL